MNTPKISLIVPTRGRPDQMMRFLDSLHQTAACPQDVEVIAVVDEDDAPSHDLKHSGVAVHVVVVPAGATMGALNMAGYDASRGEYIMLANDDIVIQTPGWDEKLLAVLTSFPDGIVLAHTNDGIFFENLCTFPMVSRRFCEMMGGICQTEYERYRIDDHIHNVFHLLRALGHDRAVYLPDIVFEHQNFTFSDVGRRTYTPNPDIHARDTAFFDATLEDRRQKAIVLAEWIETWRRSQVQPVREAVLAPLTDAAALRRPEMVRVLENGCPVPTVRVTVGVVSGNSNSDYARTCLERLKKYTCNFELILIDNNFSSSFNHSRDMNRLMDMCRTDYLVVMDDDVWVEPDWLEHLLAAIKPDVGVVVPIHLARDGGFSFGGIVMHPDATGHHTHIYRKPDRPTPTQTLCSAVMLIDMDKVGHLRLGEHYSKHFLDIDYGMRVWEAGFKVVVAPDSVCTHLGGATFSYGTFVSNGLFDMQRQRWESEWTATGRYRRLVEGAWSGVPEIARYLDFPRRMEDVLTRRPGEDLEQYAERARAVMELAAPVPILLTYVKAELYKRTKGTLPAVQDEAIGHLMLIYGMCGRPYLIDSGFAGWDTYVAGMDFLAIPTGATLPEDLATVDVRAPSLAALRAHLRETPLPMAGSAMLAPLHPNSQGYAIFFRAGEYFCVPVEALVEGRIEEDRLVRRECTGMLVAASLYEANVQIGERTAVGVRPSQAPAERLLLVNAERQFQVNAERPRQEAMLRKAGIDLADCAVLVPKKNAWRWHPYEVHCVDDMSIPRWAIAGGKLPNSLAGRVFKDVLVPWPLPETWGGNVLEIAAGKLAERMTVLMENGKTQTYGPEHFHRVEYNKAYLGLLFRRVPTVVGRTVLEVGCSDGLVSDMMSMLGAKSVVGIDPVAPIGETFFKDTVTYRQMSAVAMDFEDETFDLTYSIATMEHVSDPFKAMEEMVRVTKRGGYVYIQAAPLYHSPFGHHMFSYFDDVPWIHLLKTPEEICALARATGQDERIRQNVGMDVEAYVDGMLSKGHVNMLRLEEYDIDRFLRRRTVECLYNRTTYEGKDLLTPEILEQLAPLTLRHLTEHGFGLILRKL